MLPHALVLAVATAPIGLPKGGGACSSAVSCGLNGACAAGHCACAAAWTGAHCGALHLLPAPVQAAYPPGGPNGTAVSA